MPCASAPTNCGERSKTVEAGGWAQVSPLPAEWAWEAGRMTRVTPPGSASDGPEIEAPLVDWVARIAPIRPQGPGRPPLLAATVLWMSLTIGVRRGAMSQTAIWRLVVDQGLGRERHVW